MPTYSQAGRSISLSTPLGPDQLLLVGFRGQEGISQLFHFELDMLADANTNISFAEIIGQNVTVAMTLPDEDTRYFNGIVKRFSQGASDETFTVYHAEVVPQLWLLKKSVQSRIFQSMSVPDILSEVLSGYDVRFKLTETYYQRNYCVQYRESDFDFASRLMEDEGIFYFFNHTDGAHPMVVADVQTSCPDLSEQSAFIYEPRLGGVGPRNRIRTWQKAQELRANQYTLGDYCFEMPSRDLDQSAPTIDQVQVGTVTHKLNPRGQQLEIYEYPGGCAKRYDCVDRQGGAFAAGATQMSDDRNRIVEVRMEEEESTSVEISGTSDCGSFSVGCMFTLEEHFNGDDDYLLTGVVHNARQSGYRNGEKDEFDYDNRFACMPARLTYRPRRVTAKPVIAGFQTAMVTGTTGDTSSGQSVYCDQYGRVKVQFQWDRQGTMDSNSSCWLRVAQIWAGNGWGAFFWPRVGHEVVVAFEEGDPDQPLIVGSVYNADNMPPFPLPASSPLGGIRSASVGGTANQNFNGIIFNDTLGTEHLAIHSENNMSLNSEGDKQFHGTNKGERVAGTCFFTVGSIQGLAPGGGSGGGKSGGGSGGGPTAPVASLLPSTLSFGDQNVGTTSAPLTVTFSNTASTSLTVSGITITGTNSGDYAQTNTYGSSLNAGGSFTISVTFTPGAQGPSSATLTVTDSAGNTYNVSLSGTGLAADFVLTPSSLSFGNQDVGDGASQTVTLSNTGSVTLSSLQFALSGPNSGDYSQSNSCGTLLPGGSCTITVTFTPSANGSSTATLTVTYSSGGSAVSTQTVELTGTGLSTGPFTQGNTLEYNPPTEAYSGQYCEVIYGTSQETIVGAYNEIVIGSNNMLVVDPLALLSFFPNLAPAAAVLGTVMSATGGNSSFTIGDNVNFSLGQQMSMTITPEVQGGATLSLTACVSQVAVIDVLAGLLSSLSIVWAVLYAGYQQPQSSPTSADDGPIVTLLSVCQGVQAALQMAIQIAAGVYQAGQEVFVEGANGQVAALPAPEAESVAADADAAKAAKAASDADKASAVADKGVTDADKGVKDADTEVTKANQGVKDADTAVTKANQGVKDADQGVKDADQGVKDADQGVTDADQGVKDADQGVKDADQGVKDADEGVTKADQNVKDAESKFKESGSEEDKAKVKKAKDDKAKADDAKTKADQAKKDADTEKVKADKSKTDADAEKVKADKEKTKADAEKVKADKDKTDADAEKVKADKDKTDADAEKAKADKEKTKADAEKAKADKEKKVAHAKADAAKKKADFFKKSWESKKSISSFKTKVANKLKMKLPAKP